VRACGAGAAQHQTRGRAEIVELFAAGGGHELAAISIRDSARSAARLPSSTLVSVRSSTSLTCTSYNRTLRDDQL